MDEALSHYLRSLSDPEIPVELSDVERLMNEYPFFTLPALSLLQRDRPALPADTRKRLLSQIALNAPDPASFVALSDSARETWMNFYPPEKKAPVTTNSVIDTFLATYGQSSPQEDALLERLIFHPAADYSMILAGEEENDLPEAPAPDDNSQDALINSFLLKQKGGFHFEQPEEFGQPDEYDLSDRSERSDSSDLSDESQSSSGESATPRVAPVDHPVGVTEVPADTSLSESLAKIYIRRRRYDKAFEIIHGLSLNNPKKSVYFADQLRFLRKLMLNSSLSEQNKPSN
ncbi:MAG: hypothetical protein HDS44_05380 [Bacteroides sp.]|nr:hypothetical protein [Bacteroides sp.]